MRARLLGVIVLLSGAAIASACGDSDAEISAPTTDAGVADASSLLHGDSSVVQTTTDGATSTEASADDDDDAGNTTDDAGDAASEAGDDDDAGDAGDASIDDAGDASTVDDAGDASTTHRDAGADAGNDAGDAGDAGAPSCRSDDDCNVPGARCSFLVGGGCSPVGECLVPPSESCTLIVVEHACACDGTTLTWNGGCKPQYTLGYGPAPATAYGACPADAGR